MVTKTRAMGSLALSVLVAVAAVAGGGGVRAANAEQVRLCGPVVPVPSELTPEAPVVGLREESAATAATGVPHQCGTPLPASGPSLTPEAGAHASPAAVPGSPMPLEYDVCYLVADSEMEALFHRELAVPPSGTGAGGVHDCLWSFDPEAMEMAVVWLGDYNGWADLAGLGAEAIAGVGDEALWVLDGQLWVRIGDTAITVMVISETLDAKDAAVAIARLAVPRIR